MKKKIIIGAIVTSTIMGGAISIKAISDNSKNDKITKTENKKDIFKDGEENKSTNKEENKNTIKEEIIVTNNIELESALNKLEDIISSGEFQKALDIINSITFKSDIDDLNWRLEHLNGNAHVAIYDEEIISNAESYLKNGDYKNAEEMISRVKGVVIENHETRIKKVVDDIKGNNSEFKNFTYEDAVNRLRNFIGDNYDFELAQENEDIIGDKTYYITAIRKNSTFSMMYIVRERGEIRQGS